MHRAKALLTRIFAAETALNSYPDEVTRSGMGRGTPKR
jgi:hypothetical protein